MMSRAPKAETVKPGGPRLVVKPDRRTRSVPPPFTPPHDRIATRAYELFIVEGASHGHDIDHWLRAEQELLELEAARPSRRAAGTRSTR
jgi:hypothetical protein